MQGWLAVRKLVGSSQDNSNGYSLSYEYNYHLKIFIALN